MKVQINGFLSETMHAERGTGQGDPLSSHLYDLAANPLNIMLAESDIVPRPILPNNKEITLEAYADDYGIPLSNNIQRIKDTIEFQKCQWSRTEHSKMQPNVHTSLFTAIQNTTSSNSKHERGQKNQILRPYNYK